MGKPLRFYRTLRAFLIILMGGGTIPKIAIRSGKLNEIIGAQWTQ